MPREDAASRARSGQVSSVAVTVQRPETAVRGRSGDLFTL